MNIITYIVLFSVRLKIKKLLLPFSPERTSVCPSPVYILIEIILPLNTW
jgi:hypothetical protein